MGGKHEKSVAIAEWIDIFAKGKTKASKDKVRVPACFVCISSGNNRSKSRADS